MHKSLKESIKRQRTSLFNMLVDPMSRAARACAKVWDDREKLDQRLLKSLASLPYGRFMYALGNDAVQISANASQEGLEQQDFGRDRSERPYMKEVSAKHDMTLSEAYISLRANRPSVTAIQKVYRDGEQIGYLGADFDLRALPLTREIYEEPGQWQQLKGDPAIRSGVFQQHRIDSMLDEKIDQVLPVIEELMTENGVFHSKIHFSSNRCTLWFIDDPYRYRILPYDALVDPDVVLAYPNRPYPKTAIIKASEVRPILDTFKHLRFADDTIYLRAGSLNIFNGIVGLNFSCDGSHYIPHDQFLARDSEFWEGM
ncbi:MAG: PDC sensor domain-containing protein [Chromatiales bacterium]|jgi:hypothetical protein